jgi:3-hydroxyisobutyrate dehydrogenase-like beta-hydroxyacid dehydrogenase
MVGGAATQFERARRLLECIGKTVVLCGPTGAGQIAKACNQLVVISTHVAIAEALALAQASGRDAWRVLRCFLPATLQVRFWKSRVPGCSCVILSRR